MATAKLRVGMGEGGLAQRQFRSLEDLVGVEEIEVATLGLEGTTDHSEVLLDRLLREELDAVVIPTPYFPIPAPEGVEIAGVGARLTPLSAFVAYDGIILDEFEQGAVIGVDGQAQAAQLLHYRPELTFVIVDGAIRHRLARLDDEDVDALVIPAAFTEWLDLQDRVSEVFPVDVVVPAAGQGSLSLIRRSGDRRVDGLAKKIEDVMARREVDAELLTVQRLLDAGTYHACALARQHGSVLSLDAMVVDAGGRKRFHHSIEGDREDADALSGELAETILAMRQEAEV